MVTLLPGDCRDVLPTLPEGSVHCVVTSPPYWGLRDYGVAGQLGLEATPEEYLERMVGVFREVRRVLRDDGTCWVNMGDCYSAGGYAGDDAPANVARIAAGGRDGLFHGAGREHIRQGGERRERTAADTGLPPKNLLGMPWRLAFALQADGWYLRADIVWTKPNPMPESVTDRPTKAHEYVFLLSKSARYFYDADAVREPAAPSVLQRAHAGYRNGGTKLARNSDRNDGDKGTRTSFADYVAGRNLRSVWTIASEPTPDAHFATFPRKLVAPCIKAGCPVDGTVLDPFAGTGTVGRVAEDLGRHSVMIELNPAYVALAHAKCAQLGLFAGAS